MPKASPFTRTPLENKRITSTSAATGDTPCLGGQYPYIYPPLAQYPSYPSGYSQEAATNAPATSENAGEGSDAWEAAQNILKAINFGSLIQIDQGLQGAGPADRNCAVSGVVQDEATHRSPAMGVDVTPMGGAHPGTSTVSVKLSAQERATLQAHLALLAAQMAGLADDSEDVLAHGLGNAVAGSPTTPEEATHGNIQPDNGGEMERVDVRVSSDVLRTRR
jgi:hypothetical protein